MTARQYFEKINILHERMIEKQLKLQDLRDASISLGISYEGERVQSNSDKDKMGAIVSKIVDADRDYQLSIGEYYEYLYGAERKIGSMENKEYKDVLHKHYIEGMTIKDIARATKKSFDSVKSQNKRALSTFQKTLLTDTDDLC